MLHFPSYVPHPVSWKHSSLTLMEIFPKAMRTDAKHTNIQTFHYEHSEAFLLDSIAFCGSINLNSITKFSSSYLWKMWWTLPLFGKQDVYLNHCINCKSSSTFPCRVSSLLQQFAFLPNLQSEQATHRWIFIFLRNRLVAHGNTLKWAKKLRKKKRQEMISQALPLSLIAPIFQLQKQWVMPPLSLLLCSSHAEACAVSTWSSFPKLHCNAKRSPYLQMQHVFHCSFMS